MDRPSDKDALTAAWRALAGDKDRDGWNTIHLTSGAPCLILAGRHFPGNEEAILVGFRSTNIPTSEHLPQGKGFSVRKIEPRLVDETHAWISLVRQASGSQEIFLMMADDVVSTLSMGSQASEAELLSIFLSRIRAWQSFMQRDTDAVLGPASEVGLIGELELIRALFEKTVPTSLALEAWRGPDDGLQDFVFGTGAIEVKTTLSVGEFPAIIGCLDQIDDTLVRPLFLAGIRLRLADTGVTLPDEVSTIRHMLQSEEASLGAFNNLLIRAGYLDSVSTRYTRRFQYVSMRILVIDETFPKLTHSKVSSEIRDARYILDLDKINGTDVSLQLALQQLGVT
jgi:hypothetical protein